ncbi:MAG: hypothetical protein C3L24_00185, partial [Candidatus Sedimenticola endophacoides]
MVRPSTPFISASVRRETILKSIRHLWAALTLLLLWLPPLKAVEVQSDAVRIGVLAKRGESTALGKWQATADYLTRRIDDRTFHIVPLTFDEIPPVVRGGLIDFVIVNPAIYTDLAVRYDIRRILTLVNRLTNDQNASQFGSVVFTRHDRPDALTWSEISSAQWAGVHETSLGGWILMLQECRYLVKDFGTSQSPKSTRQRDSRYCPDRPALITTPSRTLQ